MTVSVEELIKIFPIWIPPGWTPVMYGPDSRTMQRISRACDRPPFQPQFGAGVDAPRGEHTHDAVVYYAHLDPVLVEPGQSVQIGTLLGCVYHMGDRGGPAHLHYQLRHANARGTAAGGRRIDPLARLRLLLNRGGWRTPPPAPTGDLPRQPE